MGCMAASTAAGWPALDPPPPLCNPPPQTRCRSQEALNLSDTQSLIAEAHPPAPPCCCCRCRRQDDEPSSLVDDDAAAGAGGDGGEGGPDPYMGLWRGRISKSELKRAEDAVRR